MFYNKIKSGIKWKERQERHLILEAPLIASVLYPLHFPTGSDVITSMS